MNRFQNTLLLVFVILIGMYATVSVIGGVISIWYLLTH